MIKGSCHCRNIEYQISGEISPIQHCHCRTCRKTNGTAYGSSAVTSRDGFRVTKGGDSIREYESSPGKQRCFCATCGSHVYALMDEHPGIVILRIGTIDGDPGVRPTRHIWVSQKAPWYEIHDQLPRTDEM